MKAKLLLSSKLTDADHDGGVDHEKGVLGRVTLDTEVCPEVAFADLWEVLASKSLEHLT